MTQEQIQARIQASKEKAAKKPQKMAWIGPTIEDLRCRGYKVRVHQYRYVLGKEGDPANLLPRNCPLFEGYPGQISIRGGLTCISILTPDGDEISASALCSKKDVYHRRYGNFVALNRILEKVKLK